MYPRSQRTSFDFAVAPPLCQGRHAGTVSCDPHIPNSQSLFSHVARLFPNPSVGLMMTLNFPGSSYPSLPKNTWGKW